MKLTPKVWYDYHNQCWIENGIIQPCNHPATMNCTCYGKVHQGEQANTDNYEE